MSNLSTDQQFACQELQMKKKLMTSFINRIFRYEVENERLFDFSNYTHNMERHNFLLAKSVHAGKLFYREPTASQPLSEKCAT